MDSFDMPPFASSASAEPVWLRVSHAMRLILEGGKEGVGFTKMRHFQKASLTLLSFMTT